MGHQVTCVDNDEAKVKTLREGGVPIYEAHLPELLGKHLGRGVDFTSNLGEAVERSEAIFIAVGTPQGETGAADLSYVEAVVSEIARAITSYKVIVEKSTVPVYTNEWIRRVLHRRGVEPDHFDVVSNPEFLREGTAVIDFLHPDRIVVGAGTERAAEFTQAHLRAAHRRQLLRAAGRAAGGVQRGSSRQVAGYVAAERGNHQARLECISGAEDFVHQCGCQPCRKRGR